MKSTLGCDGPCWFWLQSPCLSTQLYLSPHLLHAAILPGYPLCGATQNPPAHTHFSYCTREPLAGRAQGPLWLSSTLASVVLPRVPFTQRAFEPPYTTLPSALAILPRQPQHGVPLNCSACQLQL